MIEGFTIISSEKIHEVSGELYILEHKKSGARAAYLDRDDTNMTFSIAFRTPPKDSTGVFHIIEHSVLCGSKKFPVKEPFVELLKGSLNTFLNAMTYEDRTVYPVSSRCEKDFLNLTDIYLDAVFHPRMLEDKNIFLQEGWHYEYDEEKSSLSYNGVVYNEMHGAYSSPDELGAAALRASLFEGSIYAEDSGGAPNEIPSLTYEDFVTAHKTYYHPSNSFIFLDGKMNLQKILYLIGSYLNEYEKTDIKIEYPLHAPRISPAVTVEYEAADDMGARLLFGYVYSSFEHAAEDLALTVLSSALTGSNECELRKRMLDSGLCEDISMSVSRVRQDQITIELLGVKEENISAAEVALNKIISDIASEGIDKERLTATLNNTEFKLREKDFGGLPRGVAFALSAYSSWIYGKSPAEPLRYESAIDEVRSFIKSGEFERILTKSTVNNTHKAKVIMLPRKEAGEAARLAREEKLRLAKKALSESDIEKIKAEQAALKTWQNTPDTAENLNTIPALSLSDINPPRDAVKTEEEKYLSAKILNHGIDTAGIIYLSLNFEAKDIPREDLLYLNLLTMVLKSLETKSYSPTALQNRIKSELGSLSFTLTSYPFSDGSGNGSLAFTVNASALESKAEMLKELIEEILIFTDFSDTDAIEKILVQFRASIDEIVTSEALTFALSRIAAASNLTGAITEELSGYDGILEIKALLSKFSEKRSEIASKLSDILSRVCTRARLTLGISGDKSGTLARNIASIFPEGETAKDSSIKIRRAGREALIIPASISYATLGALSPIACENLGVLRVVRSILSYEYLWNNIRVMGGAYGTGFIIRKSGEMGFYSYRDPSPAASLEIFGKSSDYLRSLAKSGADLTKFIIGALGEYDILTTPRMENSLATYNYITGWTEQHELRLRRDMIGTTAQDLLRAADIIDEMVSRAAVCVAGSRDAVNSLGKACEIIGEI